MFLSSGVQGQQTIFAPLHILSHNNHARGLWVICVDQSQKFGFWATMFNRTKYLTLAGPVEVTNCHWAVSAMKCKTIIFKANTRVSTVLGRWLIFESKTLSVERLVSCSQRQPVTDYR